MYIRFCLEYLHGKHICLNISDSSAVKEDPDNTDEDASQDCQVCLFVHHFYHWFTIKKLSWIFKLVLDHSDALNP